MAGEDEILVIINKPQTPTQEIQKNKTTKSEKKNNKIKL